jgi:hypothetical protein
MVFMQSKPVWVGDLGNRLKIQKFDGRLENYHFVLKRNSLVKNVKGIVSRDFLLLVFLMNQFPPSPRVLQ